MPIRNTGVSSSFYTYIHTHFILYTSYTFKFSSNQLKLHILKETPNAGSIIAKITRKEFLVKRIEVC